MIANSAMKDILLCVPYDKLPPREDYSIQQNTSACGEFFWSVGDFCGLLGATAGHHQDLTELEWDGNELRLDHTSNVVDLVVHALGIIAGWKGQMERQYCKVPFDILLSVDYGDADIAPSVTLRFWAVRNQTHYINPSLTELEKFSQPVLMEWVNHAK